MMQWGLLFQYNFNKVNLLSVQCCYYHVLLFVIVLFGWVGHVQAATDCNAFWFLE